MFTYPFEILKLRLTTDVPELRELDWFLGQTNIKDKNALITTTPALYIEFMPVTPRDLGGKLQSSDAEFNIHLVTESVSDNGTNKLKKNQPNDHMRIFDKIYRSLSGFNAKLSFLPEFVLLLNTSQDQRVMNSIIRTSPIVPPHALSKGKMISIQRFSTIIYDHAAATLYTKITPKPPIEIIPDMG